MRERLSRSHESGLQERRAFSREERRQEKKRRQRAERTLKPKQSIAGSGAAHLGSYVPDVPFDFLQSVKERRRTCSVHSFGTASDGGMPIYPCYFNYVFAEVWEAYCHHHFKSLMTPNSRHASTVPELRARSNSAPAPTSRKQLRLEPSPCSSGACSFASTSRQPPRSPSPRYPVLDISRPKDKYEASASCGWSDQEVSAWLDQLPPTYQSQGVSEAQSVSYLPQCCSVGQLLDAVPHGITLNHSASPPFGEVPRENWTGDRYDVFRLAMSRPLPTPPTREEIFPRPCHHAFQNGVSTAEQEDSVSESSESSRGTISGHVFYPISAGPDVFSQKTAFEHVFFPIRVDDFTRAITSGDFFECAWRAHRPIRYDREEEIQAWMSGFGAHGGGLLP
jgi:hypothetical protein